MGDHVEKPWAKQSIAVVHSVYMKHPKVEFSPLSSTSSSTSNRSNDSLPVADDVFTTFTMGEKRLMVLLVALAGIFSAFLASIYFPSLVNIGKTLGVSAEMMNVTVTTYLVVQGIAPSILAEPADQQGRRPVYLASFIIYCAASLGLAFQTNYAALLVLRMVQSAGASGTVALAYGVIGDIAPPHERAGYVGAAHVGLYAAPTLGPVLGGVITNHLGWRWVFNFLAIASAVIFFIFVFSFPETGRKIVGNGSRLARGINQSLLSRLKQRNARKARPTSTYVQAPFSSTLQQYQHQNPIRFPNPLRCLKLVFHKLTFLLLLSNALFYLQYSCTQVSLAPLLQERYGLSPLQSGLCYLSYGIPACLTSWFLGKILNWDYIRVAKQHNITINKEKGDKMIEFPIEKARLRSIWYYIFLSATATLVYGWAVERKWHIAIVLATQVVAGSTVNGVFTICNTLMVDWHMDDLQTSTMHASAAMSLTRCLLAAGGVAVMDVLFQHIGIAWTFTIVAGLCYTTIGMFATLAIKGWQWRVQQRYSYGYE